VLARANEGTGVGKASDAAARSASLASYASSKSSHHDQPEEVSDEPPVVMTLSAYHSDDVAAVIAAYDARVLEAELMHQQAVVATQAIYPEDLEVYRLLTAPSVETSDDGTKTPASSAPTSPRGTAPAQDEGGAETTTAETTTDTTPAEASEPTSGGAAAAVEDSGTIHTPPPSPQPMPAPVVATAGNNNRWPSIHPALNARISKESFANFRDGVYYMTDDEQKAYERFNRRESKVVSILQDDLATCVRLASTANHKIIKPLSVLADTAADIAIAISRPLGEALGLTWTPGSMNLAGVGGVGGSLGVADQEIIIRIGGNGQLLDMQSEELNGCFIMRVTPIIMTDGLVRTIRHNVLIGQTVLWRAQATFDQHKEVMEISPAWMRHGCAGLRVSIPCSMSRPPVHSLVCALTGHEPQRPMSSYLVHSATVATARSMPAQQPSTGPAATAAKGPVCQPPTEPTAPSTTPNIQRRASYREVAAAPSQANPSSARPSSQQGTEAISKGELAKAKAAVGNVMTAVAKFFQRPRRTRVAAPLHPGFPQTGPVPTRTQYQQARQQRTQRNVTNAAEAETVAAQAQAQRNQSYRRHDPTPTAIDQPTRTFPVYAPDEEKASPEDLFEIKLSDAARRAVQKQVDFMYHQVKNQDMAIKTLESEYHKFKAETSRHLNDWLQKLTEELEDARSEMETFREYFPTIPPNLKLKLWNGENLHPLAPRPMSRAELKGHSAKSPTPEQRAAMQQCWEAVQAAMAITTAGTHARDVAVKKAVHDNPIPDQHGRMPAWVEPPAEWSAHLTGEQIALNAVQAEALETCRQAVDAASAVHPKGSRARLEAIEAAIVANPIPGYAGAPIPDIFPGVDTAKLEPWEVMLPRLRETQQHLNRRQQEVIDEISGYAEPGSQEHREAVRMAHSGGRLEPCHINGLCNH
jgi:hypothetical protein